MASGQVVRRLSLEQEIEGSNPSSPAKINHERKDILESNSSNFCTDYKSTFCRPNQAFDFKIECRGLQKILE